MSKLKYLDLFSGAGGLSEGFLQTGQFKEVAAVEWLEPQVKTLRNRLKNKWNYDDADDSVLHFDIQREEELFAGWNDNKFGKSPGLDYFVNKSNGIDIVLGGPPCQAYSIAGRVRDENGMHDDYRNYLFEHYLNIVKRYKPMVFVFENVPGLLSAKPGGVAVTELIKEGFDQIGYEIIDDLKKAIVNASDYGVPQNRKRVILLGVNKEKFKDCNIQDILNDFYKVMLPSNKVKKPVTVYEAIGDLQKFKPIFEDKAHEKKDVYFPIESSGVIVSDHVPRYQNVRDMKIFQLLAKDLEDGTEKYTQSSALTKLYEEHVGSSSQIHRYHVLRPDIPSTTIIAHLHKDGNRFIHFDSKQARTITVREAARLQSFPDDFEFLGSRGAQYQMIGNAVPPLLAKVLGNSVKEFVKKYQS